MNFKLRPWQKDDLESLVKYANNWEIAKFLSDKFPHPYTKQAGEGFITFATSHNPTQIFAIEIQGKAVGSIGVFPQEDIHRKNAELGYWLAEPFWGKGIIPQAIRQMIEYGFETFEIDRIFARPFGSNIRSQRVLKKSGFQLETRFKKTIWKKDRYEDELVYGIRKNNQG